MCSFFSGKIHKWRQQLKKHYLRNKREIRFGKRSVDCASIDELYVDLELVEEEGPGCGNQTKQRKLDSFENQSKPSKLDSYIDLFNLRGQKHHILLFGRAGSGKTTQIASIAYDWAKSVGHDSSQTTLQGPSKSSLAVMELVFVLDMRHFRSDQTLAEAIKRQVLNNALVGDIDNVLGNLQEKCLLLLDGFDELPRTCQNHALLSSHLDNLFVIVTT